MIPAGALPHRLTIVARSAEGEEAGGRFGNREPVEVKRYVKVPARVDDVSTSEELGDQDSVATFYDVILRSSWRGEVMDFDAHALIIWHGGAKDGGDLELELDGEPVRVDASAPARRGGHHLELRARRDTGT